LIDYDQLAMEQRQCAALDTRRDVWITAAVMTALLFPIGTLFGLGALAVARGSRAAIDRKDIARATGKLDLCRVFVLVGTILTVGVLLWQATAVYAAVFSPPDGATEDTRR